MYLEIIALFEEMLSDEQKENYAVHSVEWLLENLSDAQADRFARELEVLNQPTIAMRFRERYRERQPRLTVLCAERVCSSCGGMFPFHVRTGGASLPNGCSSAKWVHKQ